MVLEAVKATTMASPLWRKRLRKAQAYVMETSGTGLIFIFLTAWFLQFVSTQELIYTKSCHMLGGEGCGALGRSGGKASAEVQGLANRVLLACVAAWTLPTLIAGPLYASICDHYSQRVAICLPFIFLVAATGTLMAQAWFMWTSVYWLFGSSLLSGLGGTYVAMLGLSFAQISQHCHTAQQRSTRFAIHTGFTGLSQCLGFLVVGPMLRCCGFVGSFSWSLTVYVLGLVWALLTVKHGPMEMEMGGPCLSESTQTLQSSKSAPALLINKVRRKFSEVPSTMWRKRDGSERPIILLCITAFFFSYLTVQGSLLTTNYYLKHTIQLAPELNGYLEGSRAAAGTLVILALYPALIRAGCSDHYLSIFGLTMFLGGRIYLALVPSQMGVFGLVAFDSFIRFPQSGIRAILSSHAGPKEQAKLLTANSVLQSVASLVAAVSFNNLLPLSLSFFPPLCFVILAVVCLVPIVCVCVILVLLRRHRLVDGETQTGECQTNPVPVLFTTGLALPAPPPLALEEKHKDTSSGPRIDVFIGGLSPVSVEEDGGLKRSTFATRTL